MYSLAMLSEQTSIINNREFIPVLFYSKYPISAATSVKLSLPFNTSLI